MSQATRRLSLLAVVSVLLAAPTSAAWADNTDQNAWLSKAFRTADAPRASSGKASRASRPSSTASGSSYSGGGAESGIASYYWQPQAVASGGRFNPNALTAAHKTLPFGTRVRVTNLNNGRAVDVVINDRGPFVKGRVIDLSRRAAQDIGMTGAGLARVNLQTM